MTRNYANKRLYLRTFWIKKLCPKENWKAAKRIFSQFIVKINVLFFHFLPCNVLSNTKCFFKGNFLPSIFQWKDSVNIKKVVNLCFFSRCYYFSISILPYSLWILKCPQGALFYEDIWMFRYVQPFFLLGEIFGFQRFFLNNKKGINDKINKDFYSSQTIIFVGAKQTIFFLFKSGSI